MLLRVLEARAALLDRVADRLAALHEAALVAHRDLRDPKRAADIAGRGLELAIESAEAEVPAWLERVDAGVRRRRDAELRGCCGACSASGR